MTKVIFIKDKENRIIGFDFHGHSGYAASGNDIVCSAISVLSINTVNSIESLTDDKFELSLNEKEGQMKFAFTEIPSHDAQLLLNSLEMGIQLVAKEYGKKYIRIENQEV